jgi:hypothetical protein
MWGREVYSRLRTPDQSNPSGSATAKATGPTGINGLTKMRDEKATKFPGNGSHRDQTKILRVRKPAGAFCGVQGFQTPARENIKPASFSESQAGIEQIEEVKCRGSID